MDESTLGIDPEDIEGMFHMMDNYNLQLGLNRISPYYLFGEAAKADFQA